MYKMFTRLILSGLLCLAGYAHTQDMAQDDEQTMESPANDDVADPAAPAARFTCRIEELTRHVEVAYDHPGQAVPCSVLYDKETENPGDIKTLWSARNEAGYCEDKAANFVDQLEELGWTCKPSGQQ